MWPSGGGRAPRGGWFGGLAAGVVVPPEVEDDGFSVDIETMAGKIGSVPETQRHRRLCGNHALLEEMGEIPRVAP